MKVFRLLQSFFPTPGRGWKSWPSFGENTGKNKIENLFLLLHKTRSERLLLKLGEREKTCLSSRFKSNSSRKDGRGSHIPTIPKKTETRFLFHALWNRCPNVQIIWYHGSIQTSPSTVGPRERFQIKIRNQLQLAPVSNDLYWSRSSSQKARLQSILPIGCNYNRIPGA